MWLLPVRLLHPAQSVVSSCVYVCSLWGWLPPLDSRRAPGGSVLCATAARVEKWGTFWCICGRASVREVGSFPGPCRSCLEGWCVNSWNGALQAGKQRS